MTNPGEFWTDASRLPDHHRDAVFRPFIINRGRPFPAVIRYDIHEACRPGLAFRAERDLIR